MAEPETDEPLPVDGTLPDAPGPRCNVEGKYLFTIGVDAWFEHCGGRYSAKLVLA
jgi:hypothetical protein